jgi:hypothetical protein
MRDTPNHRYTISTYGSGKDGGALRWLSILP